MPPRDAALDTALVNRLNLRDQLIAAWPELTDDADTLLDTLAGLDNFEEQIVAIMRHVAEREAHAKALGELIDGMQARRQRLADGAKWLRAAVLHAMQETGMKKLMAPDFSLSIGAGKPKLLITDETAIPEQYLRVKREPDKIAILEAIKNGYTPTWATMSNAAPFLSVHKR